MAGGKTGLCWGMRGGGGFEEVVLGGTPVTVRRRIYEQGDKNPRCKYYLQMQGVGWMAEDRLVREVPEPEKLIDEIDVVSYGSVLDSNGKKTPAMEYTGDGRIWVFSENVSVTELPEKVERLGEVFFERMMNCGEVGIYVLREDEPGK